MKHRPHHCASRSVKCQAVGIQSSEKTVTSLCRVSAYTAAVLYTSFGSLYDVIRIACGMIARDEIDRTRCRAFCVQCTCPPDSVYYEYISTQPPHS